MSGSGRLAGKVAVVTGAGRGIGRAIALAFAQEGAAGVVGISRTRAELDETLAVAGRTGCRTLSVTADISSREQVGDAVQSCVATFGRVDVLVNNAAVLGPIGPLAENDVTEWQRAIDINLVGTFCCCHAVIPEMQRVGSGKIITLSGGGATAPRPCFSAYAVSKAAVVRLTETLAEELRPANIQVNAIAPGPVDTRMLDLVLQAGACAGEQAQLEAERQRAVGGVPASLAAELAVFLASAASDHLTGRLVSACHDDWRHWDSQRIADLMASPWLTLRRIDRHTLLPIREGIG